MFLPELEKLSYEQNLDLLKALIDDRFVFIPGFNTISEFTESIDIEDFAKIMITYSNSIASRMDSFNTFVNSDTVNADIIKMLKNILKKNVYVILESRSLYKQINHAFLLTDIIEYDDHYNFVMYNPNVGQGTGDNYSVSKKNFTLYHKQHWPLNTQMYVKLIQLRLDTESLELKANLKKDDVKQIINNMSKYSFTQADLMEFYEAK